MKNLQFFAAILLLAIFTGCSKDKDEVIIPISNSVTWNLTHVSGGLAGVDENFEDGFIKWTFNNDTQMLTVQNNNTDDMVADVLETGIYPFSRTITGANTFITIDGQDFMVISETANELKLNQVVVEGYSVTLTK